MTYPCDQEMLRLVACPSQRARRFAMPGGPSFFSPRVGITAKPLPSLSVKSLATKIILNRIIL